MKRLRDAFGWNKRERSKSLPEEDFGRENNAKYGCDVCCTRIMGPFFRCWSCDDWQVCENCWETRHADIHPHPFVWNSYEMSMVFPPTPTIQASDPVDYVVFNLQRWKEYPCLGKSTPEIDDSISEEAKKWDEWSFPGWQWFSYQQIFEDSCCMNYLYRDLLKIGATDNHKHLVGICAANRPEWMTGSIACAMGNFIWVGIHPVMTQTAFSHILANSGVSILLCENSERVCKLLSYALEAEDFPSLKYIITMPTEEVKVIPETVGSVPVVDYEEELTRIRPLRPGVPERERISLDTPMCLIYTSGSTGVPKGVIQTRRTWFMYMEQAGERYNPPNETMFSLSPLSHSSSIRYLFIDICRGVRIGMYGKESLENLLDSISRLRPSSLSGTPRFWSYLMEEFDQRYSKALQAKQAEGGEFSESELREKVLDQFRKELGGRVRKSSVGGALASAAVRQFMEECFGIFSGDGFGITEAGPVMTNGSFCKGVEGKLVDIPEMGYFASGNPPRGELCIKTPHMMSGYWNDEQKTKEAFTEDGFYRTGDICEFLNDKYTVIGRLKFHFKLSSGEFLVPELLELLYGDSPLVRNIFVHGVSDFNSPVAVIYPSARIPDLESRLLEQFHEIAEKKNLMPHERIRLIILIDEEFSDTNGLITASGKPNRMVLIAKYQGLVREKLQSASQQWNEEIVQHIAKILDIPPEQVDLGRSFREIGGDSLAAARLNKLLKGQVPPTFIQKLLQSGSVHSAVQSSDSQPSVVDPLADSKLPETLRTAFEQGTPSVDSIDSRTSTVLLTGATGFVGAFLLQSLLQRDEGTRVICLLRNPLQLKVTAERYCIDLEPFGDRVTSIKGDISEDSFGLTPEAYDELVSRVDSVVHCAAWVNFSLSYSELRTSNVVGTLNVLRFVSSRSKLLPLAYVSSNSVILDRDKGRVIQEDAPLDSSSLLQRLDAGYATTKHVAELLVQEACSLGAPCVIFRLGTVGGHSETGVMNSSDLLARILASFVLTGATPFGDQNEDTGGQFMNIIPVDEAASSIVTLFYHYLSNATQWNLFHIYNPHGNLTYHSFKRLAGDELEHVAFPDWCNRIKANQEATSQLGYFYKNICEGSVFPDYRNAVRFDCSRSLQIIDSLCSPFSRSIICSWLQFLTSTLKETQQSDRN